MNVNIPADVTVESQGQRIKDAAKAVQAELRARAAKASGEGKEVLEATALMAADPMLVKSAIKLLSPRPQAAHVPLNGPSGRRVPRLPIR